MFTRLRKYALSSQPGLRLLFLAAVLVFSQTLVLIHQHNLQLDSTGGPVVCQLCLHQCSADLPPLPQGLHDCRYVTWQWLLLPLVIEISTAVIQPHLPRAPPHF